MTEVERMNNKGERHCKPCRLVNVNYDKKNRDDKSILSWYWPTIEK